MPYLVHTGYELPLLLDGRKKLAVMSHPYPLLTFHGEDRFDHWVAEGILRKEEVPEPFERSTRKWIGHRHVYYTPKGEEWRVPAYKLVWDASAKSGGWNEHFERLRGMLFGYEDWQNDWWINVGMTGGLFGGMPFCCAVSAAGLAWIEAAGFRALPPTEKPALLVARYDIAAEAETPGSMMRNADSAAFVRFSDGGAALHGILDLHSAGPWLVPSERIQDLNRCLRRSVVVVHRRDGPLPDASRS